MGFPDSSVGKESACNAGDPSSTRGSGRSPGERIGYPLQYSWASLVTQLVKNPPAMRETWVGLKLNFQKMKIMASGPITSRQIGKQWKQWWTLFSWAPKSLQPWNSKMLLGRKAMTNLDSVLKSRDITFLTNVRLVKAMIFSSSHLWMWELDHKESWAPKNWCFWSVVLEKTL